MEEEDAEVEKKEYEVEKILSKKIENGQTKYKVRWKEYNAAYDTWEPEANLANCPKLLKLYKAGKTPPSKRRKTR